MTIMPCPCCGGEEAREYTYSSSGLVLCGSCGMVVRGGSTPDAIRAWNRLAMATSIAEASKKCMRAQVGTWDTHAASDELRRLLDAWGEDGPEAGR